MKERLKYEIIDMTFVYNYTNTVKCSVNKLLELNHGVLNKV